MKNETGAVASAAVPAFTTVFTTVFPSLLFIFDLDL